MLGDAFLKPEDAIESWDLRPGDKVADFGCGSGFFVVPIAQRVGQKGTVYALDVRQEALDATLTKIRLFKLSNVDLVRANLEAPRGSGLKDESVDKVIMTNVLFQVEDHSAILKEAFRILKPGGSVLIIEWDEGKTSGPVLPRQINRKETETMLVDIGFILQKDFYAGSHHYGLLFKKPSQQ